MTAKLNNVFTAHKFYFQILERDFNRIFALDWSIFADLFEGAHYSRFQGSAYDLFILSIHFGLFSVQSVEPKSVFERWVVIRLVESLAWLQSTRNQFKIVGSVTGGNTQQCSVTYL